MTKTLKKWNQRNRRRQESRMNEIVNLCYLLSNEKKLKFSTKNDTRLERKCSLDIHAPIFFRSFEALSKYLYFLFWTSCQTTFHYSKVHKTRIKWWCCIESLTKSNLITPLFINLYLQWLKSKQFNNRVYHSIGF